MSAIRRVAVIAGYEWRRAVAKKKILALIILAIAFQTLIMVSLSQVLSAFLTDEARSLVWISGVLMGTSFFVPLIAIITGGGSMSEEYEHGTADTLLSKPIRRVEYMSGKLLGGLSLLAVVQAITVGASIVLSLELFGPQTGLQYAPLLLLAIVYSSLIFFCLSFMFSELFRASTLAILVAFGVLIGSEAIGSFVARLYGDISRGLPTWAAFQFPSLLMNELISLPDSSSNLEALLEAVMIIAVYAVVCIAVAAYKLTKTDVTKKTA